MLDYSTPSNLTAKQTREQELQRFPQLRVPTLRELRAKDSDTLRDRYWTLWHKSHPYYCIPARLRAENPHRNDPISKKESKARHDELVKIERIVVREREETLKLGKIYRQVILGEVNIEQGVAPSLA